MAGSARCNQGRHPGNGPHGQRNQVNCQNVLTILRKCYGIAPSDLSRTTSRTCQTIDNLTDGFVLSVPVQRRQSMAYNSEAIARRQCTALKADGTRCLAWAAWDEPEQRCAVHAGRHRRGKYGGPRKPQGRPAPCTCPAYNWPHRHGSGLCAWPGYGAVRCSVPTGTHSWPRIRNTLEFWLARRLSRYRWQERLREKKILGKQVTDGGAWED
jgi:hypothetical protein